MRNFSESPSLNLGGKGKKSSFTFPNKYAKKSRENKKKTKFELIESLPSDGCAILNKDDSDEEETISIVGQYNKRGFKKNELISTITSVTNVNEVMED